jgi:regulator of replication initiation timing
MITFKEDTHEYFNGDKKLISVTQLMRKHGLAPNYDGIPDAVLRAKAERGTLIHKEIESFITHGEIGFTTELLAFKDYLMGRAGGVIGLLSETILNNDICAGTADLLFIEKGINTVADIKTTATIHKDAVSWQLSIYAKLASDMRQYKIERGQVFHFDNDGNLNVIDIPLKPVEEVERLFECERKGEIYKQDLTQIDNQAVAKLISLESYIKSIEEQKKAAEAQAVELRAALMEAMEKNGVQSFENERIKLTLVAPTTRTAIDSARLKKELPEIAEQYTKTSQVKASLRITLKEAE